MDHKFVSLSGQQDEKAVSFTLFYWRCRLDIHTEDHSFTGDFISQYLPAVLTLTDLTPRSHSGASSILCKIVWLKSLGGGAERNAVSRFQNFNSLWRCWGYVISPPISFQRYEAMPGGLALKRHRQPKHDLRRFSQMGCLLAKRCGNKQHMALCDCRAVAFV